MSGTRVSDSDIRFFEDHEQYLPPCVVSPHLRSLRDVLLDFECMPADSHKRRLGRNPTAQDAQKETDLMDLDDCPERKWMHFYQTHFYVPLTNDFQITGQEPRRESRVKFYCDSFRGFSDKPWSELHATPGAEQAGITFSTTPSLAAYFPVYQSRKWDEETLIYSQRRWPWMRNPNPSLTENFSREILEELAGHGLVSYVTSVQEWECFPWLIVENPLNESFTPASVFCIAAGEACIAILLLENLSRYAEQAWDKSHIPPVLAVTTIRREVRVWVAQVSPNRDIISKNDYNMICIWKGDMTVCKDYNRFRVILENAHTWAMRVLRPWISSYIDQWRSRFCKDEGSSSRATPRTVLSPEHEALLKRLEKLTEPKRPVLYRSVETQTDDQLENKDADGQGPGCSASQPDLPPSAPTKAETEKRPSVGVHKPQTGDNLSGNRFAEVKWQDIFAALKPHVLDNMGPPPPKRKVTAANLGRPARRASNPSRKKAIFYRRTDRIVGVKVPRVPNRELATDRAELKRICIALAKTLRDRAAVPSHSKDLGAELSAILAAMDLKGGDAAAIPKGEAKDVRQRSAFDPQGYMNTVFKF